MNRIANRLFKMANNGDVLDDIMNELWGEVEAYIASVSDYLSTGRDRDFDLDVFLEADYSGRISLIDEYCKSDDRYKEILDKAKAVLNDKGIDEGNQKDIISDFNLEVFKEFMNSMLDFCEEHGNLDN